MSSETPPKNAKELESKILTLNYSQRLKFAGTLKNVQKDKKIVDEIIKDLRKDTVQPMVPEIEVDEDLTEILPPQQRNVGKDFHRHRSALVLAASTKQHSDILLDEIKTQSITFKKFATKNYVLQEKDTKVLQKTILEAPPKVQKLLLHKLIKSKRKDREEILDHIAEELRKFAGIPAMVDMLHGCSSKHLKATLVYKNIFFHELLRWDKIFKFHQEMVFELIEEQMEKGPSEIGQYNKLWGVWKNRDNKCKHKKKKTSCWKIMLETGTYQSKRIWDIVLKYPHAEIDKSLKSRDLQKLREELRKNNNVVDNNTWYTDKRFKVLLPSVVSERMKYFISRNPDKFLEWFKKTTVFNIYGILRCSLDSSIFENKKIPINVVMELVNVVFKLSTRNTLFPYSSRESRLNSHWKALNNSLYSTTSLESLTKTIKYSKLSSSDLGYDWTMIANITKCRGKNSVFWTFSPYYVNKLVTLAFKWFNNCKPEGLENTMIDRLGWIELVSTWTFTWLSRLRLKKDRKTNKNRYSSCIDNLLKEYNKVFNDIIKCPWRLAFDKRLKLLQEMDLELQNIINFWNKKCKHENKATPTQKEENLSDILLNCLDHLNNNNYGYYEYGINDIQKLSNIFNDFKKQFYDYKKNIKINKKIYGQTLNSRAFPLKKQLQRYSNKVKNYLVHETRAIFNYDYLITFYILKINRKLLDQKLHFEMKLNLFNLLLERKPQLFVNKVTNTHKITFQTYLSNYYELLRNILDEVWDSNLNKKLIDTEYGWKLGSELLNKYVKIWNYGNKFENINLSDSWHKIFKRFYSTEYSKSLKYNNIRSGSNDSNYNKKSYYIKSLIRLTLEYCDADKRSIYNKEDKNKHKIVNIKQSSDIFNYYMKNIYSIKPNRNNNFNMYKKWESLNINGKIGFLNAIHGSINTNENDFKKYKEEKEEDKKYLEDETLFKRKLQPENNKQLYKYLDPIYNSLEKDLTELADSDINDLKLYKNCLDIVTNWRDEQKEISSQDQSNELTQEEVLYNEYLNILKDSLRVHSDYKQDINLTIEDLCNMCNRLEDNYDPSYENNYDKFGGGNIKTLKQVNEYKKFPQLNSDGQKLLTEIRIALKSSYELRCSNVSYEHYSYFNQLRAIGYLNENVAFLNYNTKIWSTFRNILIKIYDSIGGMNPSTLSNHFSACYNSLHTIHYTHERIKTDKLKLKNKTDRENNLKKLENKDKDGDEKMEDKKEKKDKKQESMDVDKKEDDSDDVDEEEVALNNFKSEEHDKLLDFLPKLTLKIAKIAFDLEMKRENPRVNSLLSLLEFTPISEYENVWNSISKYLSESEEEIDRNIMNTILNKHILSKRICKNFNLWNKIWTFFKEEKGQLETTFDSMCIKMLKYKHTTNKEREIIFLELAGEEEGEEHMKYLLDNDSTKFVDIFQSLLDEPNRVNDTAKQQANKLLNHYLELDANNSTPEIQDKLIRYLDITNHKIRKRFEKLADSNSVDEREQALRHMISATLLTNDKERDVQIRRTVKFFTKKIKNEAIDRREKGLEILFGELKNQIELILESNECLESLKEMLQDCFEVQDLDLNEVHLTYEDASEHRILRHFMQVSIDAIEKSVTQQPMNKKLFEFGVELQWRICKFRKGDEPSAKDFRLFLGDLLERYKHVKEYNEDRKKGIIKEIKDYKYLYFHESNESSFVKLFLDSYETRVKELNPNYLDDAISSSSYLKPLFKILGKNWTKCNVLIELLNQLIDEYEEMDLSLDENDDLIIGNEVEKITGKIIMAIIEYNKSDWYNNKIISKFLDAVFKALKTLHEKGYDNKLKTTQTCLVFMLDDYLHNIVKDKKVIDNYIDNEYKNKIALNTLLNKSFEILSYKYIKKYEGRFWSIQWELHKIFRLRMIESLKDLETIIKIDSPNDLPAFKWSIFKEYWNVNFNCINNRLKEMESEIKDSEDNKDTDTEMKDKEEEKEEKKEEGTKLKERKDKVPSLFDIYPDTWKDSFKYENVLWAIDIADQFIFGGKWLLTAEKPYGLLVTDNDWKGLLVIPTQVTYDTSCNAILKHRWQDCNVVSNIISLLVKSLKLVPQRDIEGLYVIENDHPSFVFMEKLINKYHSDRSRNIKMKKKYSKEWFDVKLLMEYNNIILKSRQIKTILWRWLAWRTENPKRKGYISKKRRGEAIKELLDITKSAIYLRFVWRHLLQYDQKSLNEFINSGKAFRGVFYVKPDDRTHTKKQKEKMEMKKQEMKGRYKDKKSSSGPSGALKTKDLSNRKQKRGGGKVSENRMLRVTKLKRDESKSTIQELTVKEQCELEIKEQIEFENEFEEWKLKQKDEMNDMNMEIDDKKFDHRDIWRFEGCYQLNRLLPEQLSKIGERHLNAALNKNRGMPERVKAIIRWTLLPTTTYGDIVKFFDDHKKNKLPINLLEALLKGVMENDEVLAPMHYLLQPQFLKGQQARVAAFAIQKSVSYIHRNQYTKLLKAILSGKRRNNLKITAYKQIIRMLVAKPSRTHVRMVKREWDRDVLHRDVRIVILTSCFNWIRAPKQISYATETSWEIFTSAATHPDCRNNIEIMTALMGATLEGQSRDDDMFEGLTLKPRITEHLATFSEFPIPKRFAKKWAAIIILLCDRVYTLLEEEEKEKDDKKDVEMKDKKEETKDKEKEEQEEEEEEEDDVVVIEQEKEDTKEDEKDDKKEEKKEEEKEEDKTFEDGKYLRNDGRERKVLDDIAFMAMRTLEIWCKYNESIVKDAVRILAETVCDFSLDFILNNNKDTQTVMDNRFKMACKGLHQVLKMPLSDYIRTIHLDVIPQILERFVNVAQKPLNEMKTVLNLDDKMANKYSLSDELSQGRLYKQVIIERMNKFMEQFNSFSNVPLEHYNKILAPLESKSSLGMYNDYVLARKSEILRLTKNREEKDYINYVSEYIKECLYFGVLDNSFVRSNALINGIRNIINSLIYESDKCGKLYKLLLTNKLEISKEKLVNFDVNVFKCDTYKHLNYYVINELLNNISVKQLPLLANDIFNYMKECIKLLALDYSGESKFSISRKNRITFKDMDNLVDFWMNWISSHFIIKTKFKSHAYFEYLKEAKIFFDYLINTCKNIAFNNKILNHSDIIHLKLFIRFVKSHTYHFIVLYGNTNNNIVSLISIKSRLPEIIQIICNSGDKKCIYNILNPFTADSDICNLVYTLYNKVDYNHRTDYKSIRKYLIKIIFDWLLSSKNDDKWNNQLLKLCKYILNNNIFYVDNILWDKIKSIGILKLLEKLKEITSVKENPREYFNTLKYIISRVSKEEYSHFKGIFNNIYSRSNQGINYDERLFLLACREKAGILTFCLGNNINNAVKLLFKFGIKGPKNINAPSWREISTFIYNICYELSPKYSSSKFESLNKNAVEILNNLFKQFIETKLVKQSSLKDNEKVIRNVCISLLTNHSKLVNLALQEQIANVLKYVIELVSSHHISVLNNSLEILYDGNINLSNLIRIYFDLLNPKFSQNRRVGPITNALLVQIIKVRNNKSHKNNLECSNLLWELLNNATSRRIIMQSLKSNNNSIELLNTLKWMLEYFTYWNSTDEIKLKNRHFSGKTSDIANYLLNVCDYFSPLFESKKLIDPNGEKLLKFLVDEACDFKKIVNDKYTHNCIKVLASLMTGPKNSKWIVIACGSKLSSIVYAFVTKHILISSGIDICKSEDNLSNKILNQIVEPLEKTQWELYKISTKGYIDFDSDEDNKEKDKKPPSKKRKLNKDIKILDEDNLHPKTQELLSNIFSLVLYKPLLNETKTSFYYDVMIRIITDLVKKFKKYLFDIKNVELTCKYILTVCEWYGRLSKRFNSTLLQEFISNFESIYNKNNYDSAIVMIDWIKNILKLIKSTNYNATKNILTQFAFNLTVNYGHHSAQKASYLLELKEKEEEKESSDKQDIIMEESKTSSKKTEKKKTKKKKGDAYDFILWIPQYVTLLNEFENCSDNVIKRNSRYVVTCFVDSKAHKDFYSKISKFLG